MEFEMDELYLTIINNLNDGVYFVDLDRNVRITYLIILMRTAGRCALSAVPCSLPL